MSSSKNTVRIARDGAGDRPAAFDGLRAELAVVMVFGVVAALLIVGLELGRWLELGLLAAVGFSAGGWMAARTRRAVRGAAPAADAARRGDDGTQQE